MESLQVRDVVKIFEHWNMKEYVSYLRDHRIDGRRILDLSREPGRPNDERFIEFVEDLKRDPKYLNYIKSDIIIKETNLSLENQYQTVSVRKISQENNQNTVEEILKKITIPKSFLYRHQQKRMEKAMTSYVPMDKNAQKKKFFRLSIYDYPIFDTKSKQTKTDVTDRGYYCIRAKTAQKTYKKQDIKTKYKSLPAQEDFDEISDDHFYEDLCYNDTTEKKGQTQVKPCLVKIQELFQSFKFPFFKKAEVVQKQEKIENTLYENQNIDSAADAMYDSVHPATDVDSEKEEEKVGTAVEEYLEPVQVSQEYCDVGLRQDESLLAAIMGYFESRFGRRDSNVPEGVRQAGEKRPLTRPPTRDERGMCVGCVGCAWDAGGTCWWVKVGVPLVLNLVGRAGRAAADVYCRMCHRLTDVLPETSEAHSEVEPAVESRWESMAGRPLPVPVEGQPFFMSVERGEAENLLLGQPDGTFILRPSSQPNHAYTLSVSCANAVHNVGIRRRPDGRLALGFPRRGERSFTTVTALLQHHKKRRLLLVAGGDLIGATTLNDTPQYYQTPKSLPITPQM